MDSSALTQPGGIHIPPNLVAELFVTKTSSNKYLIIRILVWREDIATDICENNLFHDFLFDWFFY